MVKLQYDESDNPPSRVTVHYDNKIKNLELNENGVVEVENKLEAQELEESHGGFFIINDEEIDDLPDYVLADKKVAEVEEYVEDIDDVERLKELREKEAEHGNRKTALESIDDQIAELKQEKQEEENREDDEIVEESEKEDGEETEDE